MFHCLSPSKFVPTFNVGIILALIHCFIIKIKGRKGQYSNPEGVTLQRGVFIARFIMYIHVKVCQFIEQVLRKNKKGSIVACMYKKEAKEKATIDALPKKDFSHVYNLKKFFESCANTQVDPKEVTQAHLVKQEPLPSKSKSHGVIWASGGEEYDEDYDVYEHLDKVPITMPPPLSPEDFMYYPSQVTVFGTENKGPLRPIDQKPNMRGDPDYDNLSPNQQEKRDWDQYFEYQEKVLAGTSKRKSTKPKIKTQVWMPTKPTPLLRANFGAELKRTTQQHHDKARAMYDYQSPDPITQATYV